MEGAYLILGVAWVSSLGPILADFSIPHKTFYKGPTTITLKGKPKSTHVSSSNLKSLIHQESVASLHTLYLNFEPSPAPNPPSILPHPDPIIDHLLLQYEVVLDTPKTLPPNCSQDHHIPTETSTNPVNVKPYRYPITINK